MVGVGQLTTLFSAEDVYAAYGSVEENYDEFIESLSNAIDEVSLNPDNIDASDLFKANLKVAEDGLRVMYDLYTIPLRQYGVLLGIY